MQFPILYDTCFLLGLVVNVFVIISVYRSKKLWKSRCTQIVISFLCSSALICTSGFIWATAILVSESRDEHDKLSPQAWNFIFAIVYGFGLSHVSTCAALAFIRMIAVLRPTAYKKVMNSNTFYSFLTIPWVYAAVFSMPPLFKVLGEPSPEAHMYVIPQYETTTHMEGRQRHILFTTIKPFSITFASCLAMICKVLLLRRNKDLNETSNHRSSSMSRWKSGLTKALLATILVQILCCSPFMISNIVGHRQFVNITVTFYILQCTFDPLALVIFSGEYRRACKQTISCLLKHDPTVEQGNPSSDVLTNGKTLSQGGQQNTVVHEV